MTSSTSVVVITRNRRRELLTNLPRLMDLPERPPVIVVDNDSDDGSADAVASALPDVTVIRAPRNMGAAGRNLGVRRAATPYVAFADDDSWWAPGALGRAARHLDNHPRLSVVAAQVTVVPGGDPDPVCEVMAASPLSAEATLPGKPVLGFIACGAIVRRAPFLGVGGFNEMFGVGGEEDLLATDLAAAGWALCYTPDVVALHQPSQSRDRAARRALVVRNKLWYTWLRRRLPAAIAQTAGLALGVEESATRSGFAQALAQLPSVVRDRRAVPASVEDQLRALDVFFEGAA